MQFKKSQNSDLQPTSNEMIFLNLFFQNSIFYDREFLKYKCEKIHELVLKEDDSEFDSKIKRILISTDKYENPIIEGDISYNLAVNNFFNFLKFFKNF